MFFFLLPSTHGNRMETDQGCRLDGQPFPMEFPECCLCTVVCVERHREGGERRFCYRNDATVLM